MGMKRLALLICAALLVLSAAVQAASAAGPAPQAQLRAFRCRRSVGHNLDPVSRAVAIDAVMRPLPGARKMALRFQLLSRPKGAGSFRAVRGGDLGAWLSPRNPTLGSRHGDVWILNKQVVNLAAPAAYRFRVTFRWRGAHGRVLRTFTRLSPRCAQPELRPNLRVRGIDVQAAADPTRSVYVATIANAGATAAGPFQVLFSPGAGLPAQTRQVTGLGPGPPVKVRFTGPACAAGLTPTVTVDPAGQVDDFNRADNAMSVSCPVPVAAVGTAAAGR